MRAHAFAILAVALQALTAPTSSKTVTVPAKTGRPVAEAIDLLQQVYGLPVNYEDLPYAYAADLHDVTEQYRLDPGATNRLIMPRGRPFSFSYADPPVPEPLAALRTAIGDVILRDAATTGFTRFVLRETNGLAIAPVRVRDGSGRPTSVRAVLSTPITLAANGRTIDEVLDEIVALVTANSGQQVTLGSHSHLLGQHTSRVAAMNEPADALLSRVFSELPVRLVWRVLYDPANREYALNVLSVDQSMYPPWMRPVPK